MMKTSTRAMFKEGRIDLKNRNKEREVKTI